MLFMAVVPSFAQVLITMFGNDTAILAAHRNYNIAVSRLQSAVDDMIVWTNRWLIKINNFKSIRVDFAL